MVRIVRPPFDQVRQQVAPGPLIATDTQPASFGAGIGVGLVSAAHSLGDVAYHERVKADQIAVSEAAASAERWLTNELYGPNGLDRMEGKAAMERGSHFMQDYQSQLAAIRSGLHGEQQAMFDTGYGIEAQTRADRLVQQKLSATRMKYDDDTLASTQSALDNSASNIAANGGVGVVDGKLEDTSVRELIDKKVAVRALWLERNKDRLPGDYRATGKAMLQQDISQVHTAVIEAMARQPGQDAAVRAYFEAHKNEILPEVRNQVQARVTEIEETAAVESTSDEAMARFVPPDTFDPALGDTERLSPAQREKEAKEWIGKQYESDPTMKNRVLDAFEHKYNEAEVAFKKQNDFDFNGLDDMLQQNGGDVGAAERDPRWRMMAPNDRAALITHGNAIKDGALGHTDEDSYDTWKTMAMVDQPSFLNLNFRKLRAQGRVSQQDAAELENLQAAVAKHLTEGEKPGDSGGILSVEEQINQRVTEHFGTKAPQSKEEAKKRGRYRMAADQMLRAIKTGTGKLPTLEDANNVSDVLDARMTFEQKDGQIVRLEDGVWAWFSGRDDIATKIDPDELGQITRAILMNGRKITPEEVSYWYAVGHAGE